MYSVMYLSVCVFISSIYFLNVQCQIFYIGQSLPVLRKDHVLVPIASPIVGHFTDKNYKTNSETQFKLGSPQSSTNHVTSYTPRNVIPTTESVQERSKPTVSISEKIDLQPRNIRPTIGVIGLKYNFDDVWKPDKKLLEMPNEYIKKDLQNENLKEGQNWGLTTTEKYEDYSLRPLNIWQAKTTEINKQLFGEPSKENYQTTPAPVDYKSERSNTQDNAGFSIQPSIEIWQGKQVNDPGQSTTSQTYTEEYQAPNSQTGVSPESSNDGDSTYQPHLSTQNSYQQLNQEHIKPAHNYQQHNEYSTTPNYESPSPIGKPYQPVLHHRTPSFQDGTNWRDDFGHGTKPKYESVNGRWLLNGGPILQNNFFGGKTESFHGWGGFHGDGGVSKPEALIVPNSYDSDGQKGYGYTGSNDDSAGRVGNQNGYSGSYHGDSGKNENNGGYSGSYHEGSSGNRDHYNPNEEERKGGNYNGGGSNDDSLRQEENRDNYNDHGGSNEDSSREEENRGNYNDHGGSSKEGSRQEENYNDHGGLSEDGLRQERNRENYNDHGGSNEENQGRHSEFNGSNEDNPPQQEQYESNNEENNSSENTSIEEQSPPYVNYEDKSKEDNEEDKIIRDHSGESVNEDPYPDKDFGTDAAFKPPPPDHDEDRERNRISDHEFPRKVPTRLQYRGGGLWAKPHPDSNIDLGWVPKQVYSQVRRYNTEKHLPQSAALAAASTQEEIINAPRLREVVSHKKIQEVYEEEGYEDSAYNHGGYNKHGEHSEDKVKNYKEDDYERDPVKVPTEEEAHQEHAEKIKEVDGIGYDSQGSPQKQIKSYKSHPDVRGTWKSQKVTTNEKSMTFAGNNGRGGILTEKLPPRLEGSTGKYILVDGKAVPFVQEFKDVPETIISHGEGVSYQRIYQPTVFKVKDDNPSETKEFNLDSALEGSAFIPDTDSKVIQSKHPFSKDFKSKKLYDIKGKKIPIKIAKSYFFPTESPVENTAEDLPLSTIDPIDDENSTTTENEENNQTENPIESAESSSSSYFEIQKIKDGEPNVETYSSRIVYLTSKNLTETENSQEKENIPLNHKPGEESSKLSALVTPILFSHKHLLSSTPKTLIYGQESSTDEKNKNFEGRLLPVKSSQSRSDWGYVGNTYTSPKESLSNLNIPTFSKYKTPSRFGDSLYSPSGDTDSVGQWSIHQTAFNKFNDKLGSTWEKFTPKTKSHNSVHVVRRSNRKYEEIPRNSSTRNNVKSKEGNTPLWNEQENGHLNIRHPFLPKDDNGEPVELNFEVRTTERPRQTSTTSVPRREPIKTETVLSAQKAPPHRKTPQKLPAMPVSPVTNQAGYPYLSLKPILDSGNIPDDLLFKLQSNAYLATVYNISEPETIEDVKESQNDTDASAKHVEQLTIAHFSNPESNVMYKPVPLSQQERISTLAQQLNKPTESVFRIDAGIDIPTDLNTQQKRIRRSPGTEELINVAAGGTTTQIPLDVSQYPFYVAPPSGGFSKYSALRYATNPKHIPRKTEGGMEFYESRDRLVECEEPTPPKDVVPKREKDGEWDKNPQSKSPRLGGLGDKISCLKAKYFGKDPLDNPFFKETTVDVPEVFKTDRSEKLEDQLGLYMDIIGNINSNSGISDKTSQQVQKSVDFLTSQNFKRNIQNTSLGNYKDYNKVKDIKNNNQEETKNYKFSSSYTSLKPILVYPMSYNDTISSSSISEEVRNKKSDQQQNNLPKNNFSPSPLLSIDPGVSSLNLQSNQQQSTKLPQTNLFAYQPVLVRTGMEMHPPPPQIYKPKRDYNRILGLRPPLPTYTKQIRVPRLIKPIYQPYSALNTHKFKLYPAQIPRPNVGGFRPSYNVQNPNTPFQPSSILGSESVNIEKQNSFYQLPKNIGNKSNLFNLGAVKLLSIDSNGRFVAQIRPYRSLNPPSNLKKQEISRKSFALDNNRIWYPKTYDVRRGEPKYRRVKRNADVNAAYINSKESKELINLLLKNKTLLLQAKEEIEKENREAKRIRISHENQLQNTGRKRNIQTSRVGGFISRHNPAYSSRYRSSNSIHDSNIENDNKNPSVFGKVQTTTERPTKKSKVRFPKLNLNSRLVADINLKKNNTQGQSIDVKPIILNPTTTTTTTTEPTTVTTTRMYKPRRVYKKDPNKSKIVDVFAVLNRQISTTTDKPTVTTTLEDIITEVSEENVPTKKKTNPRRLQHVEHRRVTKEEVFKKTYIPHGIKDRSQESFESEDNHPDLKGPIERSSTDYEEGYDLYPEADMLHNETLVYMVDPLSGVGHWESIPFEKLNNPGYVEEKVEKKERKRSRKVTQDKSISNSNNMQDFEVRRRNMKNEKDKLINESEGEKYDPGTVRRRPQFEGVEETLATSEQPVRRRSRNRSNPNRIRNKVHVLSSLLQKVPPTKYIEQQPTLEHATENPQPKRYFNPKIILEPDKRHYYFVQERDE